MSDLLRMFTIYRSPQDAPGRYVVRGWTVRPDGQAVADATPVGVVATLGEARGLVPAGLVCLDRHPTDVAAIVETWL